MIANSPLPNCGQPLMGASSCRGEEDCDYCDGSADDACCALCLNIVKDSIAAKAASVRQGNVKMGAQDLMKM